MKRGQSGLSFVVGINKPLGLTSHDVVGRVRKIFSERRVGHTGTLDPLASGVLAVCVGPATRLVNYLQALDKQYIFKVVFGTATNTGDAAGTVSQKGEVPQRVFDPQFAAEFVAGLVGKHQQVPPAYSAIKVDGETSYQAARAGKIIEHQPRPIEIYEACLLSIEDTDGSSPAWEVSVRVSKGTYIRVLAEDMGKALGCPSHVGKLERTRQGILSLGECVSLEQLEVSKTEAILDPVKLLGFPLLEVETSIIPDIKNGKPLPWILHFVQDDTPNDGAPPCHSEAQSKNPQTVPWILHFVQDDTPNDSAPPCYDGAPSCHSERSAKRAVEESISSTHKPSNHSQPKPTEVDFLHNEFVSVVTDRVLLAIYQYDKTNELFKPSCVFAEGVMRG